MTERKQDDFSVLIVDDEPNLRSSLAEYLGLENIRAETAETAEAAKEALEAKRYEAIVLDLRLPGLSGLDFLWWLKESGPSIPVLMISAHGDIADAVEAMKRGAADYLVKPFDPAELVLRLRKAVGDARLVAAASAAAVSQSSRLIDDSWIGSGPGMTEIRRLLERVAPTNSTVLITGESGTGKEVVARLLHRLSPRRDGPFVAINMGGIPGNLLESELFGYEKGAFTGAEIRKIGLFELASSGTLFLDEIGDMPMDLQVKLLRVLQEKRIQRLGGVRPIPIDVRIAAATNKNLESAVQSGRFREDLFYRLNVIPLRLPPLRDRREDIPPLAARFAARFAVEVGRPSLRFDPDALRLLTSYDYPGNVRELENAVERAVILCDGDTIKPGNFSFAGVSGSPALSSAQRDVFQRDTPQRDDPFNENAGSQAVPLRELEKQAIADALARYDGHREKSAAALGITRRTLLNKIKEYGIEPFSKTSDR